MSEYITVAPNDVCRYFDRVSWSLIEEPDICELCRHYLEDSSQCGCEARNQTEQSHLI